MPATALVERALRSPDVTDLRPTALDAPSVRHPWALHDAEPPELVWYASYGSNLLRERFLVYLLGGRLPGLAKLYPGGPGTTGPLDERAVVLPGQVGFALDAPAWGGGGVAFWDPDVLDAGTAARAWLVTRTQFEEVVHLENDGVGRERTPLPSHVWRSGWAEVGEGAYGRVVVAGAIEGAPVVTFTTAAGLPPNRPSDTYAGVVERGLLETFGPDRRGGVDLDTVRAHLAAMPGR